MCKCSPEERCCEIPRWVNPLEFLPGTAAGSNPRLRCCPFAECVGAKQGHSPAARAAPAHNKRHGASLAGLTHPVASSSGLRPNGLPRQLGHSNGSSANAPELIVHGTLRAHLPGAKRPTPGASSRFKFALESHFAMAQRYVQVLARRPFLRNTHAPYGAPGLMPWKYSPAKPRTHAPVCFRSNIPGFPRRKTGAFVRSYERGQPITSRRALRSPFDSRCLLLARGSAQM